ncbi:MAG: HEAT repeat domain-containing protein, partial [Planctomycetota bacterium]|nr:HEAT repeat domain-containing protein [Planctomycetota bacterium]
MVANGSAPRWRRIQPGEAFTIQVVNDEIAYKTLGKVKMTLRFYGSRQGQAPPDAYAGLRVSNSITFEVVDNALLRELRTEKPDLKVVRKEMLALLRRLDEKGHRIDKLFEEMEREHGALLVPPLLEIAADKAVDVTLRARAADHSGSAVYYARDKETPGLRKLALPVLKSLLFDPSVPVRVRAICGLCCADRTKPHLDRFRELLADPDETVRARASGYLTRFMDHKETWPFVKEALMDSSLRARRIILGGRDLRFPTTRDHVELLLDCCRIANAEDTVKLLKGMKLSISNEDLADLSLLFDTKPEPVRIEILKLAKKTTGQKRIEIYKKALQAKSSQVRNAALAVMADSAGPSLAETLERFAASSAGSSETEKAKEILAALNAEVPFPDVKRLMAEILPPKATPPPAEKLVSQIESWEGRVAATKWLFIAEDPKDMDLFRSLLNAKRGVLRAIACRYLGRMKDQTSFRSIARLTQDPSALVRRIAARRLGELGRPEAIPCLLRLKNDPGDEVRSAVSRSLRKIPGSKATGELLELVKTEGKGMSWSIQENALDGLVERRDCGVVPALIELIDPPQSFSPTPSLPGALRKLTGHQITGDYDDPKDRTRLEKEWRQWWGKTAASRAPELPEPEASYLGCRLKLSSAKQIRTSQEVIVGLELRQGPDLAPLTVPVKDEGVEGHYQYVLFREGREVERGDFG